jgi:hypothetical protein
LKWLPFEGSEKRFGRRRQVYFSQRLEKVMGDARSTWEVLGEVLGGGRRKRKGATCGFFSEGWGRADR